MESSRTRNSILDWLIAATLAFAAISGLAGIDVEEVAGHGDHLLVERRAHAVEVLERIRVLKAAGVTQLGLLVDFGSLAQEHIMRSLEVFARDVLPEARGI